jgi:GBP family porin
VSKFRLFYCNYCDDGDLKMTTKILSAFVIYGFSIASYAQSTVTVFGNLDLGVVFVSGATSSTHVPTVANPAFSNEREIKLRDGNQAGSRLGFRGTEYLLNGLSAVFVIEAGILLDTGASDQGGIMFGRQAYVGLSNEFGALTIGRQTLPHHLAFKAIDAMDDAYAGGAGAFIPTNGKRINNSIKYSLKEKNGFSADVIYGFGEVVANSSALRTLGTSLTYNSGPVLIKFGHHSLNNVTATNSSKNTLVGGIYNFDSFKLHALYNVNKGIGTFDTRDYLLGLSVPMGKHLLMFSTNRKDDRSAANRDATMFGMAYSYFISKRTSLYTSCAKIENENGANFRTIGATAPLLSQTGAKGGTRELNLGMRHQF